ncbi:MAG: WD40 repeat domain-containing protein [Frankia sp.]
MGPDGRTLAVGCADPDVFLWDVTDPSHPVDSGLRTGDPGGIAGVAFSPDGRVLATTNRLYGDFSIALWRLC